LDICCARRGWRLRVGFPRRWRLLGLLGFPGRWRLLGLVGFPGGRAVGFTKRRGRRGRRLSLIEMLKLGARDLAALYLWNVTLPKLRVRELNSCGPSIQNLVDHDVVRSRAKSLHGLVQDFFFRRLILFERHQPVGNLPEVWVRDQRGLNQGNLGASVIWYIFRHR